MQTRPRASVAVESAKERSRKIVWKFELLLKLRPEMAHNSPSPPHTHTHTQSQQRLVRARAILRGRLTRERERLAELVDGGAEATSDSSVVVLNKMFAGAISVNSVVLCLLIQHTPPTDACPCTPYLPTHSQPARGQLFDPHHLQNFM